MEEMNYLFNTEYIGTNIVSFFIFSLYIYMVLQLFSKETLEFKNKEEIEIKKYLLFFCFYKKNIKVSQIVRINYAQTGIIFFNIILTSFFFLILIAYLFKQILEWRKMSYFTLEQ